MCAESLGHVWLSATPRTVAHQAPLSLGVSRQEHWSRRPFPPPGDLPNPGVEPASPVSPASADGFFTANASWEALRLTTVSLVHSQWPRVLIHSSSPPHLIAWASTAFPPGDTEAMSRAPSTPWDVRPPDPNVGRERPSTGPRGPEARPSPSSSNASSRLYVLLPHRISLLKSPHFPPIPWAVSLWPPIAATVKDTGVLSDPSSTPTESVPACSHPRPCPYGPFSISSVFICKTWAPSFQGTHPLPWFESSGCRWLPGLVFWTSLNFRSL